MNRARSEIEAAGARVILIGQATPRHAAHYKRRYAPELMILADEDRSTYKAMGLRRGTTMELIGPKSVARGIAHTLGSGGKVIQGRPVGDVAQLGGTFLVLPGGEIAWSHPSEDASDNATIEEVVGAVQATTAKT